MKQMWELIVKAKTLGIDSTGIVFTPAQKFSPYLELNFEDLNDDTVPAVIEINPYYRFLSVFKDYFDPDYHDDLTIRMELFNLIIHYLAELDTYMGMTSWDYEIILAVHDINCGFYGDKIRTDFDLFNIIEKKLIAGNLLRHHTLAEGVHLFQDTVRKLYPKAVIYGNMTDEDVIVVHLLMEESDVEKRIICILKQLFLPCHYGVEIFWIHLFGIIGVNAAMKLEEIVMY